MQLEKKVLKDLKYDLVSIPQAVGTVATLSWTPTNLEILIAVSIPQAVGTVATNTRWSFAC